MPTPATPLRSILTPTISVSGNVCRYSHLGRAEGRERIVNEQAGKWGFLTTHARVLLVMS